MPALRGMQHFVGTLSTGIRLIPIIVVCRFDNDF
jgi:hypothetical protein